MTNNKKKSTAGKKERTERGTLAEQPCWSFIKELNSVSEERLDSTAIKDGYRQYTYRQMFRYWERYAEAFSGMNITAQNHSRVGLIGTPLTETVFAFYGLNMTGASVSLIYPFDLYDEKQIHSMIEREHITDLLISELYAFPLLMKRLLRDRELLGLRNIILLESPMGGDFGIPALEMMRNTNKELFRELDGGLLMEDLLKKYDAYPITYGEEMTPIILHTTGTVSGMHKPVPMTDKAMNSFVLSALKAKEIYPDFKKAPEHMITYLTLNMSWVYAMVDMLHTPLGMGMELVSLPMGATNPRYSEAIEHYGINVLFTSKSILDSWLKTMPDINLSKLKVVFMGGTYISPEYKKKFNDYLRSCGSSARIINGYGLSEMGGACLLAPSTREDDAIGFLLPGFKAKIYVEDEKRFYDISDGPRTGLLFLSSPTMSTGKLGDTVFFELDRIGKEDYFNSNDLVRVNEDGSLTCIGRSNQFFVNNAGVRFDAGLIENAITSRPGITACGLAPEFHKTLHDNIPVLYVEMSRHDMGSLNVLRTALIRVFIKDNMLADTNMPSQCVIVDRIPLNSSGKVDAKKLASGTVTGSRYSVKPVRVDDKVLDILLVPAAEGENATMGAGIPAELEGDPYNILSEVFAIMPDLTKGDFSKLFHIPGLREMVMKLTGFDISDISGSMWNFAPKMFEIVYRKYLVPFMKGMSSMGDRKKPFGGFLPMIPPPVPMMPMPFMPNAWGSPRRKNRNENDASGKEERRSARDAFFEQMTEMQKSWMEQSSGQWNQFLDQMMDMEDMFASSMPDENPFLSAMRAFFPFPKEATKHAKGARETAERRRAEQADSENDPVINELETERDAVNKASDSTEKKEDTAKEMPAAETRSKKTAGKKTAAAERTGKERGNNTDRKESRINEKRKGKKSGKQARR